MRESVLLGLGRRVGRFEEMEDHPLGSQKRHISRLRDRAAVRKDSVFDLADIFRETMKSGLLRREGMTGGRKQGKGGARRV